MFTHFTSAITATLSKTTFRQNGFGLRLRGFTAWMLCYLLVLNPLCAMSVMTARTPAHRDESQLLRDSYLDGLLPEPIPAPHRYQQELLLSELAVMQDDITLDKRQVDRMVFAIFAARNLRQRRLSELAAPSLAVLVEAYKLSPALNPSEIAPLFQLIRNNLPLAKVLPPKSLLRTGMVTATEITSAISHKTSAVTPALVEKINLEINAIRGNDFVNQSSFNDVLKPLQQSVIDVTIDEFLQGKLEEAFDLAIANEAFYLAFRPAFADYLGVSMFDGASTTLRNSPSAPDFLKSWIKPDGTLTTTSDRAMAEYEAQFTAAQTATQESVGLLKTINANKFVPSPQAVQAVNRLIANPTSEEFAELAGDKEEEKFKKRDQLIDQVSKGINAVAKVIGYLPRGGAENAEKIRRIGESVVKFAKDVNSLVKFVRIVATNPLVKGLKLTSLLPLGSPLMAIGVIGVAFIAFKLFKRFGRSDRAIKAKLEELNKKIDALRQEMHDRFDRVDKRLEEILVKVDEGFRNLDEKIDEVRGRLVELSANLTRLESNIYGWLEDLSRRELRETINLSIGYKTRTGLPVLERDFDRYSNTFYTWAVDNSKDSIAIGPANRDYSDSRIYDELTIYPLEANINYLAQFPARNLGLPALTDSVLANPRYWAVSTNADTLLRAESPDLNLRIPVPTRRKAMFDNGRRIQALVEAITILNNSNGLKANHPLFDKLLGKYDQKAIKLREAIKKVEDDYKNAPANKAVKDVNIWGDANQSIANVVSFPNETEHCNTQFPFTLPSPDIRSKIEQAIPSPFLVASNYWC